MVETVPEKLSLKKYARSLSLLATKGYKYFTYSIKVRALYIFKTLIWNFLSSKFSPKPIISKLTSLVACQDFVTEKLKEFVN